MSDEFMTKAAGEIEKTYERTGKFIARLGDLNIGNREDGIPSKFAELTDAELNTIAAEISGDLQEPTDLSALGCIDGRKTLENADGSVAEIRLRRVGGTAANLGTAMNADAEVLGALNADMDLGDEIDIVDDYVKELTGVDRSAHLGGCGGANGEIVDHEAINTNTHILAAAKTFMGLPEVRDFLGVDYDDELGEKVRANAGKTAQILRAAGWDGQAYVDSVVEDNPRGVENLEVDADDHKFHGHKEDALVVVIGDKTATLDDMFVWNLQASKVIAGALGGEVGSAGYTQAMIAEVAKHMAVANRLPGRDTPVLLVSA